MSVQIQYNQIIRYVVFASSQFNRKGMFADNMIIKTLRSTGRVFRNRYEIVL